MTRTFELNDVEQELAEAWKSQHLSVCKYGRDGHAFASTEEQCVVTSTFGYYFLPTGICTEPFVVCDLCKERHNILDPDFDA